MGENVALLAEGVDRNNTKISDKTVQIPVALLAEGVDRNIHELIEKELKRVALLAEGVDRNRKTTTAKPTEAGSPSSQRAWIEIPKCRTH